MRFWSTVYFRTTKFYCSGLLDSLIVKIDQIGQIDQIFLMVVSFRKNLIIFLLNRWIQGLALKFIYNFVILAAKLLDVQQSSLWEFPTNDANSKNGTGTNWKINRQLTIFAKKLHHKCLTRSLHDALILREVLLTYKNIIRGKAHFPLVRSFINHFKIIIHISSRFCTSKATEKREVTSVNKFTSEITLRVDYLYKLEK